MRARWIPLLVVVPALLLPASAALAAPACTGTNLVPHRGNGVRVRAATLCLVNRERARASLRPLRMNRELRRAANGHSAGMVREGVFTHGSVIGRLRAVGYLTAMATWAMGENIAYGYGGGATAARTVSEWMHSPPHRENILTGTFRDAGVGLAMGVPSNPRRGATYTLDFGMRS
jgi:uncharacterized protein YkwD